MGLHEIELRAKKCIELRLEYVTQIPSLFAVDCFLPGRAKISSHTLVFESIDKNWAVCMQR